MNNEMPDIVFFGIIIFWTIATILLILAIAGVLKLFQIKNNYKKLPHEFSTKQPKTKIGYWLCFIGIHYWKYDSYRKCKRCGRSQTLYEYPSGMRSWED